ncbi:hypothetical protein [Rhodoferax sp.]|uniref:hypothetical protein n=1 Tax=Rhodoferax sp. TaxID=50421 RepID=UPI0019E25BB5|nr:hypothetical protein [Rhodoferax sp.]MBE0475006.1 hypothetical protein [Rhodoferax sp.]
MAERTYTSAIARLRLLPEIFTGSELTVLFGWRSAIASSYLAQWRKAGLVKSLGGRSDVHMNLVRNPQADPEQALRRAFPTAVKVGIDRLRAAGWTTQIAARPEVAIPSATSRYSVEGFDLVTRPAQWFQTAKPGTEQTPEGLDSLRPAWALADMLSRAQDKRVRNAWLPDPDDIDLPALGTPAHQDLQAACRSFGLVPDAMTRSGYAKAYDQLNAQP